MPLFGPAWTDKWTGLTAVAARRRGENFSFYPNAWISAEFRSPCQYRQSGSKAQM
jgi:hypothetical protein